MIEQDRSTHAQDPSSPNLSFNSESSFIQRDPHDRENHYTKISNALIRDSKISPQCKWFIIYLLSFEAHWTISIPQIMKKQNLSKDNVYSLIAKAREAGYVLLKKTWNELGHITFRYYVSESPRYVGMYKIPPKKPKKPFPCLPEQAKQDASNNQLPKIINAPSFLPPLPSASLQEELSVSQSAADDEFSVEEKKEAQEKLKRRLEVTVRKGLEPIDNPDEWLVRVMRKERKRKAQEPPKPDLHHNAEINRPKAFAAYAEWTARSAAFKYPLNKPDDIGLIIIKTPKGVARLDSTLEPDEWDRQLKSWRST
jgi:hypothetical protein